MISGLASRFNIPDLVLDCVMPGAFNRTLSLLGGRHLPMLWEHRPGVILGAWTLLEETERGLLVTGHLDPRCEVSRSMVDHIKSGVLDGLSIGFKTLWSTETASGWRLLHEVDLHEISVTAFPLHPQCRIIAAKQGCSVDCHFTSLER